MERSLRDRIVYFNNIRNSNSVKIVAYRVSNEPNPMYTLYINEPIAEYQLEDFYSLANKLIFNSYVNYSKVLVKEIDSINDNTDIVFL